MTKVKLQNGMRFAHRNYDEFQKGNTFTIRKYDFYDDGEEIWCAETEKEIYPLSEIVLENYIPNVDGKWVNDNRIEYED